MIIRRDLFVLGLSFLLLALPVLMVGLSLTRDAGLFSGAGQRVEGRVIGPAPSWPPVHLSPTSLFAAGLQMAWTDTDGSPREGAVALPADLVRALAPGSRLPLLAVPGLPGRAEFDGLALTNAGLGNVMLAALLLAGSAMLMLRHAQLGRNRRRLFQAGKRIMGTVTKRRQRLGGTILCYAYETDGRKRHGHSDPLPASMAARYWTGGPIELLFDPESPGRSAPDLRRPERRPMPEPATA